MGSIGARNEAPQNAGLVFPSELGAMAIPPTEPIFSGGKSLNLANLKTDLRGLDHLPTFSSEVKNYLHQCMSTCTSV